MFSSKAFLNWSSGKDAMWSLHQLQEENLAIKKLVTTINTQTNRVSMHGLRRNLLEQQAKALNLPLYLIELNGKASMEAYTKVMHKHLQVLQKEGFTHSVYGDILLEDLREYREAELANFSIKPVFPLWKKDTKQLMLDFIDAGYKAVVITANANYLDKSFCGRTINKQFLQDLPANVDWCGENGEFHTFVYDGPLFSNSVKFRKGEVIMKDYGPSKKTDCFKETDNWDYKFWFIDLLPA